MRAQLTVPAVILLVAIILLASSALWLLQSQSVKAQYYLQQVYRHYERSAGQQLELKSIEWRYVDEWHAYPVIRLVNTGHHSIEVKFAGIYVELCTPVNTTTVSGEKLITICRYIWWQEGNDIDIVSEDGDNVVVPGETLVLTTTKPIPLAYLYLWNNTYLTFRILTDEAKVITFRILGSKELRGGVEINVYLDNMPAKSVRVWLVDNLGRSYEALAYNLTNGKLAYIIIPTLPPGTYELHLEAISRATGSKVDYTFRVTVDPGETETIVVTGSTLGNTSLGQRTFLLDLHHLPEWSARELVASSYVLGFNGRLPAVTDYDWNYGLGFTGYKNLTVVLLVPPLAPGEYVLEVGGRHDGRLLAAWFGPPGNITPILNAFNWTPPGILDYKNCRLREWYAGWYEQLSGVLDFTLECRVAVREYRPHYLVLFFGAVENTTNITLPPVEYRHEECLASIEDPNQWSAEWMIVYNITTTYCPFCSSCEECRVVRVIAIYDNTTNTTTRLYTLECINCTGCQPSYGGSRIRITGYNCTELGSGIYYCQYMRGLLEQDIGYRLLLEARNATATNPHIVVKICFTYEVKLEATLSYKDETVTAKISHLWLLPSPQSLEAIVYRGTIWPGDAYNLTSNNLTKISSGLILYLPCDNQTTTPSHQATQGVKVWWTQGGVNGNYTAAWLPEYGAKINYTFTVNCDNPTGCILYAYALPRYMTVLGAKVLAWVRGVMYVDGNATAIADANTWTKMKARLTPGKHNITITLEHVGYYYGFKLGGIDTGLDHILLVKDRYIVVTGLKPGYIVELRDSSGLLLKRVRATSNTVLIDAEEVGIAKFPLNGMIIVYKAG